MSAVAEAADDFQPAPIRIIGEAENRRVRALGALSYHNAYLDDCLRAILPNDLVLIGAPSGIGKTDLALAIAEANAAAGKRVHIFALEAERAELERRRKFSLLSERVHDARHPNASDLNYTDWLLFRCEEIVGPWNDWADDYILAKLGTLNTYYRGEKFNASLLKKQFERIAPHTDLIILDHFHYVDAEDHENENRAQSALAQLIRDLALVHGKPVIVVAHLRKRDPHAKQLCATLDDFHGSSNLVKNATQVIAIDRADALKPAKWFYSPTFLRVLKDRRAGATPLVAVVNFDRRLKKYGDSYSLGRLVKSGSEWEELDRGDEPHWAKRHVSTKAPPTAINQTDMED